MAKRFVSLGSDPKRIEFSGDFVIEDEFLHGFFDSVPAAEYDTTFARAFRLGVYALAEERIAAFLGTVERELDGRLEELKMLLTVKSIQEKYAGKGDVAEAEIDDVLQAFVDERGWADSITRTGGTVGVLPRRKVGDLVARINGKDDCSVVIEAKWDKSVTDGDPTHLDESANVTKNAESTAYGQNLTAVINRTADVSIFVSDVRIAHASLRNGSDGITYHPEIPGFVVLVDRASGDWSNLRAAYTVARSLALLRSDGSWSADRLGIVCKRLVRDLSKIKQLKAELSKISKATKQIDDAVNAITRHHDHIAESASATDALLTRMLNGENPTDVEWKAFYEEARS